MQFEGSGDASIGRVEAECDAFMCWLAMWKVLHRYMRNVLLSHRRRFLVYESENQARWRRLAAVM